MKLSWGLAASCAAAAAAAQLGHVHVCDGPAPSSAAPSSSPVDADTARLILAHRLGLDRFHAIAAPDAAALRQINAYGGRQSRLFGARPDDASRAHVLVWLDDVADAAADLPAASFAVQDPPAAADNDRLLRDLIAQAESLPRLPDPQGRTYATGLDVEAALSPFKKTSLHNDYLTVFRAGKHDDFSRQRLSAELEALAAQGVPMTVIMMPPSSSPIKRAPTSYGAYLMPAAVDARRQNPEALLSLTPEPSTSPNPSDMEDFPVIIQAAKNATVRGILPACFSSLASCQKQTLGCSGHGECKLLHKRQDKSKDCYGCACVPTVEHVDEDKGMEVKRKVTYWGGPACQKKDISIQFWLFVGTGVTLAFLVATIIGMMYSIGSEELPSVIGAGVSGPVRK
jgi:hypothetical protein